jgi:GR25 family glycosyltransferase involved in LPS biosynthesis
VAFLNDSMDCILINLATQPSRRERVEANFRNVDRKGWKLSCLKAVDVQQVISSSIKGRLTDPEKGCFLSHLVAINSSRNLSGHTMIVEDDVCFGQKTFATIDLALQAAANNGWNWDIMFTDVVVPDLHAMVELYRLRKGLVLHNEMKLLSLKSVVFAGSTAYLVNAASKDKLLGLLTENAALDVPYDLTLRRLVRQDRLIGFVIFPFPTSLSSFADASTIQTADATRITDATWNAFRRMVWSERSVKEATSNLDLINDSFFDPECQAFTKILSCMLSANFQPK